MNEEKRDLLIIAGCFAPFFILLIADFILETPLIQFILFYEMIFSGIVFLIIGTNIMIYKLMVDFNDR